MRGTAGIWCDWSKDEGMRDAWGKKRSELLRLGYVETEGAKESILMHRGKRMKWKRGGGFDAEQEGGERGVKVPEWRDG